MEQIQLAYDLLKETVTPFIVLYKNAKVKFRSPDDDIDFFDIFTWVS